MSPLSAAQLTKLQNDGVAAQAALTQLDATVFNTTALVNPAAVHDDGAAVAFKLTALTNDIAALVADAPLPTGTPTPPPVVITTPPPVTPPTITPVPTPLIPGLFVPNQVQSAAETLAATLGIDLTLLSGYTDGTSWTDIGSGWLPSVSGGVGLLIGIDLTPNGTSLAEVPANVSYFATLATRIPSGSKCRLGWEMDIGTGPWGVGAKGITPTNTPALYVAACEVVIPAMLAANPTLEFDFCCNTGTSTVAELMTFYGPNGDSLYTYIGGDHYDNVGGGGDFSQFGAAVNLAAQRGKPVSGGEIGLNGTDNPAFVWDYAQFVLDPIAAAKRYGWPAYEMGYSSWFNYQGADLTKYANSAAEFKGCFGTVPTIAA